MHPFALLLALHVAAASAFAAPAFAAPARATLSDTAHPKPQQWRMTGELSFTDVGGNRSLSLLSTRFAVTRLAATGAELRSSAAVRYGRSNGEVAVADYALNGEIRFSPHRQVSPFVTLAGTRDDVRNIDVRLAVAAGADLNLVRDSAATVSLGLALLQDYEAVTLPPTSTEPASSSVTRMNLRLGAFVPIRQGVSVHQRSTLQPVAHDPDDYLLTTETAMQVLLSRRLAFQTSFIFNRDTTPPDGVLFRNDRTLTVGLVLQLH